MRYNAFLTIQWNGDKSVWKATLGIMDPYVGFFIFLFFIFLNLFFYFFIQMKGVSLQMVNGWDFGMNGSPMRNVQLLSRTCHYGSLVGNGYLTSTARNAQLVGLVLGPVIALQTS